MQSAKASPRRGKSLLVTRHSSLITAVMLVCAGCGAINPVINEGNYLTYDHPFTDAAAQSVLQNAEKVCAERKRTAVKTGGACSLKQCITHYLCVDETAGGK